MPTKSGSRKEPAKWPKGHEIPRFIAVHEESTEELLFFSTFF